MRFRNSTICCLICLLVLWTISGCDRDPQSQAPVKKAETLPSAARRTIVCVGDSLTEGYGVAEDQAYPALLQQKLLTDGHAYTVINAGISGETSSGTLSRIHWIMTLKPDIVLLETGANDGLRGTDPELTRKNIRAIVQTLKRKNVIVILAGMEMLRNMGTAYTTAFREIYTNVAEEEHLLRIPFFLAGVAGNPRLNQADGIHPTAEGYQVVVEKIYPYVLKAIGAMEGGLGFQDPAP
jgi:acyl-CoA thioesterase I